MIIDERPHPWQYPGPLLGAKRPRNLSPSTARARRAHPPSAASQQGEVAPLTVTPDAALPIPMSACRPALHPRNVRTCNNSKPPPYNPNRRAGDVHSCRPSHPNECDRPTRRPSPSMARTRRGHLQHPILIGAMAQRTAPVRPSPPPSDPNECPSNMRTRDKLGYDAVQASSTRLLVRAHRHGQQTLFPKSMKLLLFDIYSQANICRFWCPRSCSSSRQRKA